MSYGSEVFKGKQASLAEFGLTILAAILFFIYASIAIYTKDGLWFYPKYDGQAVSGLVRCFGSEVYLETNPADLAYVNGIVNEQLSGSKRWDELNLSDQSLIDYQTLPSMMVLELFYDTPQRVHSNSPFFSGFNSLLIPLEGRHADTSIVFSLINGLPAGSSFHVESFAGIKDYLAQKGICPVP